MIKFTFLMDGSRVPLLNNIDILIVMKPTNVKVNRCSKMDDLRMLSCWHFDIIAHLKLIQTL